MRRMFVIELDGEPLRTERGSGWRARLKSWVFTTRWAADVQRNSLIKAGAEADRLEVVEYTPSEGK